MPALGLGQHIKASLTEAGTVSYPCGIVGVSDEISMGSRGTSYSLQLRDLVAVETTARDLLQDWMIVILVCDKNTYSM